MVFDENFFGKQYLNKCTYTITLLWNFYMNTIDDMQNANYFYGYCNMFEYNHDYVKLMKHSYIYTSMYTKYNYMYMCESLFIFVSCQ